MHIAEGQVEAIFALCSQPNKWSPFHLTVVCQIRVARDLAPPARAATAVAPRVDLPKHVAIVDGQARSGEARVV